MPLAISRLLVLPLLVLLAATLPVQAEEGLREAHDLYAKGDYAAAHQLWTKLAEKGSADALYSLGQLYRRGEGVEKNPGTAKTYYGKAARMGHSFAQSNLGTLYFMEDPPNLDQAIKWWKEAASNGEPNSQYRIGVLYFNGDDLPVDQVTGYAWMLHAVAQGHQDASRLKKEMESYLSLEQIDEAKQLMAGLLQATKTEATPAVSPPLATPKATAAPAKADTRAKPALAVTPAPAKTDNRAKPPLAAVATPPQPAQGPATPGKYVLQFGAFGSPEAADRLWQSLLKQHPDLMRGMTAKIKLPAGGDAKNLHRLQGQGGFNDRGPAVDRCEALKARNVTCFVVLADGS